METQTSPHGSPKLPRTVPECPGVELPPELSTSLGVMRAMTEQVPGLADIIHEQLIPQMANFSKVTPLVTQTEQQLIGVGQRSTEQQRALRELQISAHDQLESLGATNVVLATLRQQQEAFTDVPGQLNQLQHTIQHLFRGN